MIPLSSLTAWTDAFVIGLLAFALRATVLLGCAWVATSILRRASAATRHAVWATAIAGILALPLLAVVVPAWTVPVISIAATLDGPLDGLPVVDAASDRLVAGLVTASLNESPAPAPTSRGPAPSASPRVTLGGAAPAPVARRWPVNAILAAVWLGLTLLLLMRLAIANARVAAWRRGSRVVEDARWLALLRRLSQQHGIGRPVMLLENETDVPVTWGVVYPVILLPDGAREWDEERRIAVLTHELAHVKRFDALSQLFAQLALALLWFHPLVWMALRRMRVERERACDDFVLVAGARASRYADDLLGIARNLSRPTVPAAAALAMARRSELEGRLLAILDPDTRRGHVRRARVGLLAAAVVLLAMPLAAFTPGARVSIAEAKVEQPGDTGVPESMIVPPDAAAQPGVATAVRDSASLLPQADALEDLTRRVQQLQTSMLQSPAIASLARVMADTEPVQVVDDETLLDVTRAANRMTSDHEKGLLLRMIAKRDLRSDALRDAYIDAVSTMTSDTEKSHALIALLDRDSLPPGSAAQVLRATATMTSDANRGAVLKVISPAVFADSAVQRAYMDAISGMTSDMERRAAIGALAQQRPLTPAVQVALLRAMSAIGSNADKAKSLLSFLDKQGSVDEAVRRAFFRTAETLTSDADYRRVIAAVMR